MSISNVPPANVEHHGHEYLIAGFAAFAEFLSLRYGMTSLAWVAALLFWLASCEFTKRRLSGKSRWLRYGIPTLVAIVAGVGTFAVTRTNPAPSAGQQADVQTPIAIPTATSTAPSHTEPVPPKLTPSGKSTISESTPKVSIEQHSDGANSPNTAVVGDNNQVTVNPPANPLAPSTYYDFNGVKHTQTGNRVQAEAGEQVTKFQEMEALEKAGMWAELQNKAESQMKAVPTWLTPYLFAAEAYAGSGNKTKAVELCEHVKQTSGGNPDFDGAADKLLAALKR